MPSYNVGACFSFAVLELEMPTTCTWVSWSLSPCLPEGWEREDDMRMVSDILRRKGHAVWSIHPDATVYEALQLMADKDIGALLAVEDGRLVGIFSERDYARK